MKLVCFSQEKNGKEETQKTINIRFFTQTLKKKIVTHNYVVNNLLLFISKVLSKIALTIILI